MAKRKYNFDASGYCCQNEKCKEYRKKNAGHVRFHYYDMGKSGKTAYLKCRQCKKIFSERKGSIFFRKRYSPEKISQVIQALSEGLGVRAASRVFEVTCVSILSWSKLAAKHMEELEKKF